MYASTAGNNVSMIAPAFCRHMWARLKQSAYRWCFTSLEYNSSPNCLSFELADAKSFKNWIPNNMEQNLHPCRDVKLKPRLTSKTRQRVTLCLVFEVILRVEDISCFKLFCITSQSRQPLAVDGFVFSYLRFSACYEDRNTTIRFKNKRFN
jgi:hypothetical protein